MPLCLIVGASRGIGRELALQYAAEGWQVIATYRSEADGAALAAAGAQALRVDVLEEGWERRIAVPLAGRPLDLAVIAAGVSGPKGDRLGAPSPGEFDEVMRTNVLPALQLIPAIADSLAAAQGKLAVLSSRMGSIAQTTNPSWWLYRASKAALNSVLKSASVELGPRGVVCMALHPGWVRTDMGGPQADLAVPDSAASLRRVMAATNRSHNGRFLNYNGEQLEW